MFSDLFSITCQIAPMAQPKPNADPLLVQLNSGNRSSTELEQASRIYRSWVSAALRGLTSRGHVVRIQAFGKSSFLR